MPIRARRRPDFWTARLAWPPQPSYFAHIVRKYIAVKREANREQIALLDEVIAQNGDFLK